MSRLPAWYKLYLIRKIKRIETALSYLSIADDYLHYNFNALAKHYLFLAKRVIK